MLNKNCWSLIQFIGIVWGGLLLLFPITDCFQERYTPISVPLDQPVEVEAIFLGYSPSAWIVHCHLLRVKSLPNQSPENGFPQRTFQVERGHLISIPFDSDADARVVASDGKSVSCRRLSPGILLRLRGVFSSREHFSAEQIRMVDSTVHLKRASLCGQITAGGELWADFRTDDQKVYLLTKWYGGVKLRGIDPLQFEQKGFAVLEVGSEVEVHGWDLDGLILVESLSFVKVTDKMR